MFISACTFQKLSVPTLSPSHLQPSHHSPVQVSRSVPSQLGQAWQPHRKLSRAGLSSSQSGQKFRPDKISVWSRERDQHGGKRRKQDLNRSVRVQRGKCHLLKSGQENYLITPFRNVYYNKNEFDKDSLSSSESNPEDHIYEEIDSDTLSMQEEEDTEDNFLLSISRERQRNLKFYGSAGWDFGSVM